MAAAGMNPTHDSTLNTRGNRMMKLLAAAVIGAALAFPALAQTYPNRPIRLIIGNPTGEAVDVIFRLISENMSAQLGQPIVVENRPGAAAVIGLDAVIQSAPDGYTIGTFTSPSLISGLLNGREWKPDAELTAIGMNYQQGILMALNPNVPLLKDVKNGADLVRVVKANPGKINFGSVGIGSTGHLIGELMAGRAGLQWQHVPYKGGVPMIQAIVAGAEPIVGIGASVPDAERNPGRLLVIATSGGKPQSGVAPISEAGFPGLVATTWGGLVGPGRLPAPVLARLEAAYKVAFDTPAIKEKTSRILVQEYLPPPEFARVIRDNVAMWGKVIKDNNIKP
jgi:tripartite-type tricarboxylate transporter receptor subunit TctC